MNSITVTGNLAADPELAYTKSGRAVAKFTIMDNTRRKNEAGEWEDGEPNVFRVEIWGADAEHLVESVGRGDRVSVIGSISTDRWTDKQSGEARTAQVIKADEAGASFKWATASITKATRTKPEAE